MNLSARLARRPFEQHDTRQDALERYTRVARAGAVGVIRSYSSSFALASALLGPGIRADIASVYGLVRLADEIVDGVAHQAGLDLHGVRTALEELEAETMRALNSGYSSNLLVHAFAETARRVSIDVRLIRPFFASMRRDTDPAPFDEEQVREYIYGSAEVVGLMCVQVFHGGPVSDDAAAGARSLGAAFQKVNFLRDLRQDRRDLGRNYFPEADPESLSEEQKQQITADIRADLSRSADQIPVLPTDCRYAVAVAHALFAELTERLARTPVAEVLRGRVRLPAVVKVGCALRALIRLRLRGAVSSTGARR